MAWAGRMWIHEPGFPVFEVDSEWIPDTSGRGGSMELTIRQVQPDEWPTFRVQIEVEVDDGSETRRRTIEISERQTTIRLGMTGERPTSVVLDPDGWVLKGGN